MTTGIEGCRVCSIVHRREPALLVAESARWVIASLPPPVPIVGWVMLCARDHVRGPGYLDDDAAASYGPVLRHLARIVERETGALRVYTAALGEADPHFHTHLVPRYEQLALGKKGFEMFELQRLAANGSFPVDEAAHARMLDRLRVALGAEPLPG